MLKKKLIAFSSICLICLFAVNFMGISDSMSAKAESNDLGGQYVEEDIESTVTRGLFTTISISIRGGNNAITATARNDFTMFPSTIPTYVELFSSTTYKESCTNMVFEGSNYTGDLNIYESLQFSVSTNGENKYWLARVRYKFDNDAWTEKSTGCYFFDATGNRI